MNEQTKSARVEAKSRAATGTIKVHRAYTHMRTFINHRWTVVWWTNLSLDRQTEEPDGCETAESPYSANRGVCPRREALSHHLSSKKRLQLPPEREGKKETLNASIITH